MPYGLYRVTNMSAHMLLYLFKGMRKSNKRRGFLSLFHSEFSKIQ